MSAFYSLARIEKAGGPKSGTMSLRLTKELYPGAKKDEDGRWLIPADQAVEIVAENLETKGLLSLPDVCVRCGLSVRTLNPRAVKGAVKAKRIAGKWYVSEDEAGRLESFYKGTVTTGQAAKMLGMNHRKSIHFLMEKGVLPYQQIGVEKRIKVEDVEKEKNRRGGMSVQQLQEVSDEVQEAVQERPMNELEVFSHSMGLDLDWRENHNDICVPILYRYINQVDDESPTVAVLCNHRRLCTMPRPTLMKLFGTRLGTSRDKMDGDGEIRLVLHRVVEALFAVKNEIEIGG